MHGVYFLTSWVTTIFPRKILYCGVSSWALRSMKDAEAQRVHLETLPGTNNITHVQMFLYETRGCGTQRWVVWQQTYQQQKWQICGVFSHGDQLLNALQQSQILLIITVIILSHHFFRVSCNYTIVQYKCDVSIDMVNVRFSLHTLFMWVTHIITCYTDVKINKTTC
jgi:hypothetical protein